MELRIILSVSSFLSIFAMRKERVIVDPGSPAESRKLCSVPRSFADATSYAGFFNVGWQQHDYLFFWFFVSKVDTKNTPLVVWLQGQPGISSLYGLFEENGPISIDKELKLKKRKYAWTNKYNVLYLDPHTNCGFSYSDPRSRENTTVEETSMRLQSVMRDFFRIFPKFKKRDLYLSGEFDSGAYMVVISFWNAIADPSVKMNIKGILVGGGFTFQHGPPDYDELFYAIGITSEKDNEGLSTELRMAQAYLRATAYREALVVMSGIIRQKVKKMGYATLFDMRDLSPFNSTLPSFITKRPSFRDSIHVGDQYFKTEPALISHRSMINVEHHYLNVVLANYKLLLYTGQFDMFTPFMSTSKWISQISWPGCSMFYNSSRKNWLINGKLLGYWKHAENLTHLMIRNAGHMVGRTQPFAMYRMLEYFIAGKFN